MSDLKQPIPVGWVLALMTSVLMLVGGVWLNNNTLDQRAMERRVSANEKDIALVKEFRGDIQEIKETQTNMAQALRGIERQLSRMEGESRSPIPNMRNE